MNGRDDRDLKAEQIRLLHSRAYTRFERVSPGLVNTGEIRVGFTREEITAIYRKVMALATEFLNQNPKGVRERNTYRYVAQLAEDFLPEEEAEPILKNTINIVADLIREYPNVRTYVSNLDMAVYHLEMLYWRRKRFDDALAGIDYEDSLRQDLGLSSKVNAISRKAKILVQQGRLAEAVTSYEKSIDRLRESIRRNSKSKATQQWLMESHSQLADVYDDLGQPDQAAEHAREAESLKIRLSGDQDAAFDVRP